MHDKGFQRFKVWQKAHLLVIEVYKATKYFPDEEKFCLTNQLRRSSISICANIAEGYKKSKKDFLRYLDISNGSLEETKYHLILCRDLGYCNAAHYQRLLDTCDEVGKMLFGLSQKLRNYT